MSSPYFYLTIPKRDAMHRRLLLLVAPIKPFGRAVSTLRHPTREQRRISGFCYRFLVEYEPSEGCIAAWIDLIGNGNEALVNPCKKGCGPLSAH